MVAKRSANAHAASRPLAEVAAVVIAALAVYAAELRLADQLPWGEEARGAAAVLTGAVLAVALVLGRGGSLAEIGLRRPARWRTVPLWVFGILVAFVAAQAVVPLLLAPFFELPAPDLSRYDAVRGNLPLAIAMTLILPLTAAIPEELVYRGFFIERITAIVGTGPAGASLSVLFQALLFGASHFQWGAGGVIATTIMGAVWGTAFILCGRNLWIVILAHSTAHVALVAQLYLAPAA